MQEKVKSLRNINIIHSFINLIVVAAHIIIYLKIFWISKEANIVYFIMIYIVSFFCLIPIFFSILFSIKTITNKILNITKLLIKYFMLFEMLFSIVLSISLSENQKELSVYFYTCPFHYDINDIDIIFKDENKIKENCQMRRCFINENSNIINKEYLCNFYIKLKKNYCSLFSINNEQISQQLMKYYNYCGEYISFYECQNPYSEKNKINKINNYDYICPKKLDELINILFLYFFLIIDIIFLCSPWILQIAYIEDILVDTSPFNNDNLKETNNTSKEQNDSNNENNNSFQREPTETIIIDNIIENKNNIINENLNNKKDILTLKNININKIENENNKSKSDIQLIENKDNNIFKIINKDTIYKGGKK